MALSQADKDYIAAAIVAGITTALNEVARPAEAAPEATAKAESPFVDAPKGERHTATRAANLAAKRPGFYCNGHKTHAAHGFAFVKAACPTDGKAL